MQTSESIINIVSALALAQSEIKNPDCNRIVKVTMKAGGSYEYSYATLPKCFDSIREPFAKNNLSHYSYITNEEGGLLLTVKIAHNSGEWISSCIPLSANLQDKDLAGQITFFKRYLFNGLAGIAGDDDIGEDNGDKGPPKKDPKDDIIEEKISDAQLKRLHTISSKVGITEKDGLEILKKYGYISSRDISKSNYNKIISEIEAHKPQTFSEMQ